MTMTGEILQGNDLKISCNFFYEIAFQSKGVKGMTRKFIPIFPARLKSEKFLMAKKLAPSNWTST